MVAGKPMVQYLFDRLARCHNVSEVVLATSAQPSDDALAAFSAHFGIAVYRGSLDDVVARLLGAAHDRQLTAFVRISADSPLMDPGIVDRAIAVYEGRECDLATNVFPRSFPKGQSVEVISTAALGEVATLTRNAEDLEHVTRYFYAHPDRFRIANFGYERDAGTIQLSVDSEDDLTWFETLVGRMGRPHWEYGLDELLSLGEYRGLSERAGPAPDPAQPIMSRDD
jgi:spore coat polysaccharide biosynthesis protein SpsF